MLTLRTEPQVSVVHEKVDAVLLRRDRILALGNADDFELLNAKLVDPRLLRMLANLTGDG